MAVAVYIGWWHDVETETPSVSVAYRFDMCADDPFGSALIKAKLECIPEYEKNSRCTL